MFCLIGEMITSDGNRMFDGITAATTTTLSSSLIDFCDEDHMETFNCTKESFVEHERGLQMQQFWDAIPITLLYTITFLAGIIGNLIICIVIIRHPSMQTATNYYLFNLAVSDMIYLLFGLPFEILLVWHQYPWLFGLPFCKFRALMAEACSYVSVLTIVAFSMERFLAICYPLHSYAMSGFKRAVRIIITIWLISLLSATPFAYYREIEYIRYPPPNGTEVYESSLCRALSTPSGLYETSTIVFFAIPMLIIIVLYAQMAFEIRLRSKQSITDELGIRAANAKQSKSRRAIIKMLAVVVLTFFISWAPFHAQRLAYEYGKEWANFELINKTLFFISGFFYYFACTINPIIYNVMSQRYRVAFRETLCSKRQHLYTITATPTPTQLSRTTTSNGNPNNNSNNNNNNNHDNNNNHNNNNDNINNDNNNNNNNNIDNNSNNLPVHDTVVILSPLTDPFDAEHGSFPRTRSMRRSQNRSMRRNSSIHSRTAIFKDSQSESLISNQPYV